MQLARQLGTNRVSVYMCVIPRVYYSPVIILLAILCTENYTLRTVKIQNYIY
jgi:hypothetical protein